MVAGLISANYTGSVRFPSPSAGPWCTRLRSAWEIQEVAPGRPYSLLRWSGYPRWAPATKHPLSAKPDSASVILRLVQPRRTFPIGGCPPIVIDACHRPGAVAIPWGRRRPWPHHYLEIGQRVRDLRLWPTLDRGSIAQSPHLGPLPSQRCLGLASRAAPYSIRGHVCSGPRNLTAQLDGARSAWGATATTNGPWTSRPTVALHRTVTRSARRLTLASAPGEQLPGAGPQNVQQPSGDTARPSPLRLPDRA